MLHQFETLPPLNLQLCPDLDDVYMQSPVMTDGHAARVHAARKSAFLSMSPASNFEAFSLYFHLPLKVAAEKFGVRATAFKKRCRAIGIRHWPYRKVRSLKRSLQELHRCQEQAALSDKQQAQYTTFTRQLERLLAPETYGLNPSDRVRPNFLTDDEDVQSDDGNDSFASSPRGNDAQSLHDCSVSPTDEDNKTLSDVLPAGSSQSQVRRPAHLSMKSEGLTHHDMSGTFRAQCYEFLDVLKTSPNDKTLYGADYVSSAFYGADLFLPSEIKYADVRALIDADGEFTAHASQVDYNSDRFFDDVFLQISPDYGCLV
ncbi:RWP-RK domain [Plasmopara halstedii]|uniref:RWP-RK domain n=1 Tax=Plasmopara halstedii TaxID=4781 RepID=A0A0N7L669_PLAHL|nr:RWP-RK domain [Plasmopara halstedii]CEG43443.1 RWP-RK domain [Plasmopara halstedii]|eukprot:XP_024579812.1 RWP-RK domain [Plasmopara halstedii]